MHYYKIIIQYDGTGFAGFQWQKEKPTIQSEINNTLAKLLTGKCTTIASSRTDSGVHAMEQIVKISSTVPIDCSGFLEKFNKGISSQIRCINIHSCGPLFRPAVEAISKEYCYFFTNKKHLSKNDTRFIANISNKLDLDIMRFCIQALIGKHNFCNFYSSGSNVKSTVREILSFTLSEVDPHDYFSQSDLFQISKDFSHCYEFRIQANGFLKQMIRHLVSALWMVGSGKLSIDDFMLLLNGSKSLKQYWKVAPPNGLFLNKIHYPTSSIANRIPLISLSK